jgi:hypothetical protein
MKLYHISEETGIEIFEPRPSPQIYESIKGDVVFAITDELLHNYLLPRDCPRVTFYAKSDSSNDDVEKYISNTSHKYVITVEDNWLERIKQTTLYLYELPSESFTLLDEGAGYYISYQSVMPLSVIPISDTLAELVKRDVEIRFLPSLKNLADEISKSTLQFSIIRMRTAV